MVPIHDTDLAEERWSKTEWESYELWEKIERRIFRRKAFWIAGATALFLVLSAVPVLMDRGPKWEGQGVSRSLGTLINQLKREASLDHHAYRLSLSGEGNLSYEVSRATNCQAVERTPIRQGLLGGGRAQGRYQVLNSDQGSALEIPGLTLEFCYDPIQGSNISEGLRGIGVIPAKDLTEKRTDRISIVLLKGPSAEVSFD